MSEVLEHRVPLRYWCRVCGHHFDGVLHITEEGNTICFVHDPCPRCGRNNTTLHVTPGSVMYSGEYLVSFEQYVEAIKLALGKTHDLVARLQSIQEMQPRNVNIAFKSR